MALVESGKEEAAEKGAPGGKSGQRRGREGGRPRPALKLGYRLQSRVPNTRAGESEGEGEGESEVLELFLDVADWTEVAALLRANAAALPASLSGGTAGLHAEPGMSLSLLRLPPAFGR